MFQSSLKKLQLQHLVVTTKTAAAVFDRSNPESAILSGVFDICICSFARQQKTALAVFVATTKTATAFFVVVKAAAAEGTFPPDAS